MSALVILAIIVAAGYLVSLRIHPLKRCRTCKMTGRHFGGVYSYAYRRCRTCGGTGRQDRLGTKIFFGGTKDTGIFPRRLPAQLRPSLLRSRADIGMAEIALSTPMPALVRSRAA
jgi:hypothetical protein